MKQLAFNFMDEELRMSINDKLLSCPMCGGRPEINFGHTHCDSWAYVVCSCGVKTTNQHGKNDKQAAELASEVWNSRV